MFTKIEAIKNRNPATRIPIATARWSSVVEEENAIEMARIPASTTIPPMMEETTLVIRDRVIFQSTGRRRISSLDAAIPSDLPDWFAPKLERTLHAIGRVTCHLCAGAS